MQYTTEWLCELLHGEVARRGLSVRTVRLAENDLPYLPLVPFEFKLDPRTRKQVWDRFLRSLEANTYRPTPAHMVLVPKATGGSRQVAILTMEDRLAYEILIRPLVPKIEQALPSKRVVYGPRARTICQRWWSFQRSGSRLGARLVVKADIANFTDSLTHAILDTALRDMGCSPDLVSAIRIFLRDVMGGPMALPIDPGPSQILATAGVASVDHLMLSAAWNYARCADNFRVWVESEGEAEAALADLARALETIGMRLQESRTKVMSVDEDRRLMKAGPGWEGWFWERFVALVDHWPVLRRSIQSAHASFRRGGRRIRMSRGEVRERSTSALRAVREPEASKGARPQDRTLKRAVAELAAVHSKVITESFEPLMQNFPEHTIPVAHSVRAMVTGADGRQVLEEVGRVLQKGDLPYPVQSAWLYWAVEPAAPNLPDAVRVSAATDLLSPEAEWVCRVQAAKLLRSARELSATDLHELVATAPPQFGLELAAIERNVPS